MKDQQVVEAFLPHTPHEAFTDRIRSGSVKRSLEHFNATCRRHPHKTGSKLAIVITEQTLRCLSIRVASRSCCATQASVGDRVTPT